MAKQMRTSPTRILRQHWMYIFTVPSNLECIRWFYSGVCLSKSIEIFFHSINCNVLALSMMVAGERFLWFATYRAHIELIMYANLVEKMLIFQKEIIQIAILSSLHHSLWWPFRWCSLKMYIYLVWWRLGLPYGKP